MPVLKFKCPECGGAQEIPEDTQSIICNNCGKASKVVVPTKPEIGSTMESESDIEVNGDADPGVDLKFPYS
jgi:DNA-directed RNA polymerase subunit RPC12/RpoP